jgi:PTS system nitrogen regulatory IIA component
VKITVREAARLLSVSESEIYRWVEDGDIPCHLVNHQPLFSRAELLEWATVHRKPLSTELFDEGRVAISMAAAIERGGVHHRVAGRDRESALRAAVEHLPLPDPSERDLVLAVMLAHEKEASTGVGDGVAIPHVRSPVVCAGAPAAVAVCYLEQSIPFDAIDGAPVHVMFAMLTPTIGAHLQLLSRLSLALLDPGFKAALVRHAPIDELLAHVRRIEESLVARAERHPPHHDRVE